MLSAFHEGPGLGNSLNTSDLISHATRQKWRRTDRVAPRRPGQGTGQGEKRVSATGRLPAFAQCGWKPDAVEVLAEVLDIQD